MSPTLTSNPSLLVFYGYQLPEFELTITHLGSVSTSLLQGALFATLDPDFESNFAYYHDLSLDLERGNETETTDGTVSRFTFSGLCRFTTANPPSQSDLSNAVMRAFLGDGVGILFNGATNNKFKSFALQNTGTTQRITGNTNVEVNTEVTTTGPAGTLTLTLVASAIAILSTMTALGLIIAQRRKMAGEEENANSPTKAADDRSPTALSKIRSPFAMTSPVDGTRKYFNKLDDESVSLKSPQNNFLDPNISVVNSSFSRDEESSLEAPSMTGLNSICGYSKAGDSLRSAGDSLRSLDGLESANLDGAESCADMSALDEVRLGRVLNLDESTVGENSRTTLSENGSKTERKSTFAKLWYGSKRKKEKSSPAAVQNNGASKLAPPPKDSPTKKPHSPLTKPEAEDSETDEKSVLSKKEGDENSLLGNQSDKGSYYDQNDESRNLFYSMLGERSVNSMESDSVDFNEMYGADSSSYDEYSSMGASSKMSSSVVACVAGGQDDEEDDC